MRIFKSKTPIAVTHHYERIDLCFIMPVFFNQENIKSLIDTLRIYSQYSPELMCRIEFIIVDDHSTIPITIPEDIKLNYKLYRINDDIQWNQAGARNLGVVYATSQRLILTDCDHLFPEKLFQKIIESPIPNKNVYIFKREKANGEPSHSACNIFYISKSTFFSTLGYDEEFCGHYGYEDVMFRYFHKRLGHRLKYFTRKLKIVSTNIDRENSYHTLVRDTTRNEQLLQQKRILLKGKNPFIAHSRLFLNFKYEKVQERKL